VRRSLRFHPSFKRDLKSACDWYSAERSGLGDALRDEVKVVIDRIRDHPELYQEIHGSVRRAVIKRFPYILLYKVEEKLIVILGLFHGSRDPIAWEERF
jgi:addiction module toxin, RelE/StbE family